MDNLYKQQAYALDLAIAYDRKKKHKLLEFGIERVLDLPVEILQEILTIEEIDKYLKIKTINIEEKWQELEKNNIKFTYYGAEDFPEKLLNIPDPPFAIYYKGELPGKESLNIGMIGARQNSEYGNYMAKEFAGFFAENNINVISGMALGIDGISQREAIAKGGKSYAVLGCGVDVIYPRSNTKLYNDLIEHGGIISEYPPQTAPRPELFPPRNRIISGLSDCILVVEARQKSGTLITVDMALDQGKEVFVIPGRSTDALSYGCNKLIRNGASCVCAPEDVLEDMGWSDAQITNHSRTCKKINVSETAKDIFDVLDFNPKSQDEILQELKSKGKNIALTDLSRGILELELNGIIQRNFGQYGVKKSKF